MAKEGGLKQGGDSSLDFPEKKDGQFVISDYNGNIHTFPALMGGGEVFKKLNEIGVIDNPDCGGLGTCGECSIQIKDARFNQYKGVLGGLVKDGFTLSCQENIPEGVGILHGAKGGMKK